MRSSPPAASLEVHRHPGHTTLRLTGTDVLDEDSGLALGLGLPLLPAALADRPLVLDLGAVRYATSEGLGALVAFNRRVRSAGGRFALANAGRLVREAMAVTRLDQHIEILPDGATGARLSA